MTIVKVGKGVNNRNMGLNAIHQCLYTLTETYFFMLVFKWTGTFI